MADHSNSIPATTFLGAVAFCLASPTAEAVTIDPLAQWASGVAAGYSAFVFGDFHYRASDTQRSVFVGGDATLADFRVGDVRPAKLEVRGQLDFNRGYVTGDISANSPTLVDVGPPGLNVHAFNGSDADFAAAQTYYRNLSSNWAQAATSPGLRQASWGEITLDTQDGANVFSLGGTTGTSLALYNNFNFNLQNGSTVVINFFGDDWELHNLGFYLNGLRVDEYQDPNAALATRLFFNFPYATQISLGCFGASSSCGGIGIPGQILAPYAEITAIDGQSIGGVVAASFTDGGYGTEFGRYQINAVSTPVPSSVVMMASGLFGLGCRLKTRTA